uniref:uncharacterized protein LOC131140467 n=1 Tax=Doryrhamphus excisus TaxID=161450 RepID=UPI0025ADE123|nr:uncharacterized protein LOC131140467 [Doryrhamphus excisus]
MVDVRWWLLPLLAVTAAGANTEDQIDQNQLATMVETILSGLNVQSKMPMFSLAARIPLSPDKSSYDPSQVTALGQNVRNTILGCGVYQSSNLVAATVLRWPDVLYHCPTASVPWQKVLRKCMRTEMTWQEVKTVCPHAVKNKQADHAEYRVLQTFKTWAANKEKTGLLLLYVHASPCTGRCTSETSGLNILKLVECINDWPNHIVVFSKIFKPKDNWEAIPPETLKNGLITLGRHLGSDGLRNIFRCNRNDTNANLECVSCSSDKGRQVTPNCYEDVKQGQQVTEQGGEELCNTRGRGGSGRGRETPTIKKSPEDNEHLSFLLDDNLPDRSEGAVPRQEKVLEEREGVATPISIRGANKRGAGASIGVVELLDREGEVDDSSGKLRNIFIFAKC